MNALKTARRFAPLLLCATLLSAPLGAADDPRVEQLRNDLRTLEREVRELSQRVDRVLQGQGARAAGSATVAQRPSRADPDPSMWLPPEKWERIRPGMSAQEVIAILGAPVSMRMDGSPATTVLFYTLPIGDTGFLSGTVRLANDKVLDVQRPALK